MENGQNYSQNCLYNTNKFLSVYSLVKVAAWQSSNIGSTVDLKNECVDPRFKYVTRGCAEYVEWLGQQENPEGYGWATGKNYGYDIVKMIQEMKKI